MATQSDGSNGPRGTLRRRDRRNPVHRVDCLGASRRRTRLVMATGAYMTSSSTIHVSAGYSWIAILLDKLRLSLRYRLRLPEIDDVRNPLIAHAAIASPGRARLFKAAPPMSRILLPFAIFFLLLDATSAFAK